MANLKDIRDRIKSVKSIQQVTSAMRMVAAAKLRRAQERMEQARPYEQRLQDVINNLLPDVNRGMLDLLQIRKVNRIGYLIVTSDRGLAGAFNTNVIKKAESEIEEIGRENTDLFCIGRKGRNHFKKRDYSVILEYVEFWNELDFSHAVKFGNGIITHFLSGKVDEIRVVYNRFKNVAIQELRVEKLLPLYYDGEKNHFGDHIYEPSKKEIVESLIPRHLNVEMWKYLLESFASEMAARMVAMENATENAGEMIKSLQLQFNKVRQASITTEMLEIVGGAEALAK
ncbi:MAG: ATP synthase F1 subunit gamma [Candidatus Neomarinimicrobiota bacterium]|nr:ATP synthase F1 subunit gamma [Candidatus Neomarinimicrobiota bacterium]